MSIIKKYQPTKSNCKVTFSYPALDGVQTVKVLGDFNNWDAHKAPVMKKSKTDFSTSLELNLGQAYEFKYLVNDSQWENDFSADKYVSSPFTGIENSVIIIDNVENKTTPKAATPKAAAPKAAAPKVATPKVATPKAAAPKVATKSPAKPVVKSTTAKIENKPAAPVTPAKKTVVKANATTKSTTPKVSAKPKAANTTKTANTVVKGDVKK